jgi:DNA-binding LytR/AlgR family response regulator
LEALKDYTRVVTSEKRYCILDSIGSMLTKNHFDTFVRIHRSYAVPRHLIRSKSTHEVELVHKVKLPIGRAYKSNLDFFGT